MDTDPTTLATIATGIAAGGTILYRLVRHAIRPSRISYRIEIARDDTGDQPGTTTGTEPAVSRL